MNNKNSGGTFIFGNYYSSEEVIEIENNPAFENTLNKKILDLRHANEEFRQSILETKLFKFLEKLLSKL